MWPYKIVENGYILCVGIGTGGKIITAAEYENILSIIRDRPTAEAGYEYKLRTDLSWELVEVPVVEDDAEATEADYIAVLSELGVTINEEN